MRTGQQAVLVPDGGRPEDARGAVRRPLPAADLPLHVRPELRGRLPGEQLDRGLVRQRDPAPQGARCDADRRVRAPIEKLLAYRERMGWSFDWASSYESDFNTDVGFSNSLEQTREAIEPILDRLPPVAFRNAKVAGTDIYGYLTELFGFTVFSLADGVVYQTYSTTGRGVEFLMPYYGFLVRAPKGRDEDEGWQLWIRRHDEYDTQSQ
jgi:Bacterial protein of unknown function (DUF899)